jgi:Trm5-related predicted tRNA methylase
MSIIQDPTVNTAIQNIIIAVVTFILGHIVGKNGKKKS